MRMNNYVDIDVWCELKTVVFFSGIFANNKSTEHCMLRY